MRRHDEAERDGSAVRGMIVGIGFELVLGVVVLVLVLIGKACS